jgi:hypothetical protein
VERKASDLHLVRKQRVKLRRTVDENNSIEITRESGRRANDGSG